jgi:hypothetical protein
VFLKETINCERDLRVDGQHFQQRNELPFVLNVIGMLGHQQNSGALRGRWCTGHGEAHSRERVKFVKKTPCRSLERNIM